ncbi:MAG: amidohydrolase family protein [Bacteroidetes bacterium]|nr:amidohydrolase family protein [Bacteroidota bacterium]
MKSFLSLIFSLLISAGYAAVDTTRYTILTPDKIAGKQLMWSSGDGKVSYYYEYNDRGRGPKLRIDLTMDNHQLLARKATGVDYFKGAVEENFQITNGTASWKNQIEEGQKAVSGPVIYSAMNGAPGEIEWAFKLLMHHRILEVDMLPAGKLKIVHMKSHTARVNGFPEELELFAVSGSGGPPDYVWVTPKHEFFATISGWMSTIKLGYEFLVPELRKLQDEVDEDYFEVQALKQMQKPGVPVAITGVSVFNSVTGKLMADQTVIIDKDRITQVGKSKKVKAPAGARVIDGKGKVLLPGLWDNHVHYNRADGLYHLAAGVTNVKDMGNSLDLPNIKKRVDAGELIGPDISIMSGFIDFAGPYSGPTGKLVTTLDEGKAAVNFYADRGYQQVKLYSSIPVDWVKPLAEEAHKRGLKVCGHIPSGMSASRAVNDGYDQIIHMNMIMLNFMGDSIDTRSMGRFVKVAERARNINPDGPAAKEFIAQLKSRQTVIDPTMAVFESMFTHVPGKIAPGYDQVQNMFPADFKRGLYQGGLPTMKGHEADYNRSFAVMKTMLLNLHKAGVTYVPGTDGMAGFTLQRELEIYSGASIPNAEVLKRATLTSAQVAGKDKDFGSVEVGKKANLVLIEGNPVANISDIRKVILTVKDGNLYDPKAMYESYGFAFWK